MAMQPEKKKRTDDLLQTVRDRYKIMEEADHENRVEAMYDLKFVNVPGEQWDDNMKQARGNRPCYEFNKLRISGKRIINDMRANRPAGKVRAVEGGDKSIAEINEGLIRNIWNVSDGDSIIDAAAEYQVNAGMCCWRVSTDYSSDTAFEQDIQVKEIQNPFTLYVDPSAKDYLKRDARDWLLTERIPVSDFKDRWPKADIANFEDDMSFDDAEEWIDEETVRIAEYWYKEPVEKELWQIQGKNGELLTVDSTTDEAEGIDPSLIVKRRTVNTHKIVWVIASGAEILKGPIDWAGADFPFVMVFGESLYIDGKHLWFGLPRFAKDAQKSYNITRTAISESIANTPKSFFWATQDQAKGLEEQWAQAIQQNMPYMLYNPDAKAPGPPNRMGSADVPVALIQESQIASDEIKATTGIFDASIGQRGNETSGRAIYARQQQGEIATFNYQDNMSKGIRRTYEIILGLIPNIYDTERELRILGSDGAEDYIRINQVVQDKDGNYVRVNDMASGRYDVTITTGPNFATLRQESVELYGNLVQQFPQIMGIAGDLIFKSMDLPYSEDIADRMKSLLPPEIQQSMNQDVEVPAEVQQMMQQAAQAMQQVQEQGQLVQQAAAELESEKALNEKQKAEIKTELANVRTAKAEFDAHVAQQMLKIIQTAEKVSGDLDDRVVSEGNEALEIGQSLDETVEKLIMVVGNALQNMQAISESLNRKPIGGSTRREGGKLVADIEFDDGTRKSVSAVRDKGSLRIVPNPEG